MDERRRVLSQMLSMSNAALNSSRGLLKNKCKNKWNKPKMSVDELIGLVVESAEYRGFVKAKQGKNIRFHKGVGNSSISKKKRKSRRRRFSNKKRKTRSRTQSKSMDDEYFGELNHCYEKCRAKVRQKTSLKKKNKKCAAVTAKGKKCKNKASPGRSRCAKH